MDTELTNLKKESSKWAAQIQNSYLDRRTSALAMTTTISGTWSYPSPATNFTCKQAELLLKPVFSVILPKMGVNRHIPKEYRYAPLSHHGLELHDYFTDQGVDHIVTLLAHMAKDTYVGNLIEATLELAALEVGSGSNIFELPYYSYSPFLTDSWIKIPWQSCHDNAIVLQGNYNLPKLQRINDKFLMSMVVASDLFTQKEKLIINRCRLYLRVLSLADICEGGGQRVADCFLSGQGDPDRMSAYSWPSQMKPSRSEWKV